MPIPHAQQPQGDTNPGSPMSLDAENGRSEIRADSPEQCDDCETNGRNCRRHRGTAAAQDQTTTDTAVPEQPDGLADDSFDLPDPARAAERVRHFLEEFGDGMITVAELDKLEGVPPLYARDLEVLRRAALDRPAHAHEHVVSMSSAHVPTAAEKLRFELLAAMTYPAGDDPTNAVCAAIDSIIDAAAAKLAAKDAEIADATRAVTYYGEQANRLRAQLAEARRDKAVVLPHDWREQISGHTSHTITKLIESWFARPAGESGETPPGHKPGCAGDCRAVTSAGSYPWCWSSEDIRTGAAEAGRKAAERG